MKVLITDNVHQLLIDKLSNEGYDVTYLPDISLNEVKNIIKAYHIIVINTKTKMDKEMLDYASNLRLIIRLGSGLDIIDLDYAKKKGVIVKNTPEGNRNAVAEHALGMLLCLFNNINISSNQVKDFQWEREKNRGIELEGKTIGIIGFGNTGSYFAKLLRGFDVNILVYDKYKQRFDECFRYLEETRMESLYENCDIVSLHVPLTEETKYLVDKSFINKFKKNIYLINTSRGKVVNTSDLIDELNSGKVKGAVLDVLENEKPNTFTTQEKEIYGELFQKENLIVTPHIAGWTKESKEKIAKFSYEKIKENCKLLTK